MAIATYAPRGRRSCLTLLLGAVLLAALAAQARAQTYPSQNITMAVAFAASADTSLRPVKSATRDSSKWTVVAGLVDASIDCRRTAAAIDERPTSAGSAPAAAADSPTLMYASSRTGAFGSRRASTTA